MAKHDDKIYDAYYSEKNTLFKKKVRERVHWICSNATGEFVLDIGCSQGIAPIILGREGKNVLGIDISENAINDALANLEIEEKETQQLVEFRKGNFMLENFDRKYDTVILGEVLEHITDIEAFFNKAVSLLENNGKLIVTTPFGINDFPDHKRTLYLRDFFNLQNEQAIISSVKFFGKWIGVIYQKNENEEPLVLTDELWEAFEESIYQLERSYINNESKLKKNISKSSTTTSEKNDNKIEEELQAVNKLYHQEKLEKASLQRELIEQYNKEEKLLKEFEQLSKDHRLLEKKYNNLKNSKLGKLTTKYWSLKKKRRK